MSSRLHFGTTASQTSIHSFSFQFLSLYFGVALLYSAGLFSTSVINLSLPKILQSRSVTCALAWNGRRRLVATRLFCHTYAQAVCSFVFHCHRQENEACRVWKNAAVKQLSMRSLPFKTKHFISAVKKPLQFQLLMHASPYSFQHIAFNIRNKERGAGTEGISPKLSKTHYFSVLITTAGHCKFTRVSQMKTLNIFF